MGKTSKLHVCDSLLIIFLYSDIRLFHYKIAIKRRGASLFHLLDATEVLKIYSCSSDCISQGKGWFGLMVEFVFIRSDPAGPYLSKSKPEGLAQKEKRKKEKFEKLEFMLH